MLFRSIRVQVYKKLATRIHCGAGWASSETVLLLANKPERGFAKMLDMEANVMLSEAKSKQVYTAKGTDNVVSILLVVLSRPFIGLAGSLYSKS